VDTPVSAATVQMLLEGNVIQPGEQNDLTGLLGFAPQPIRTRLVQLTDEQPEQTPDDGVGKLQRRRFRVDIHDSRQRAQPLFHDFMENFADIAPFEAAAEPGAPTRIEAGATLTLELLGRGHVQVRVVSLDENSVTLATIEGHPLAGVVHFHFSDLPDGAVRFTIDVVERPASRVDQLSMALVGSAAQKRTWTQTAQNVVERSGGSAPDEVEEESWSVDDEAARPLEEWVRELVRNQE
jgi:hypothetical protein